MISALILQLLHVGQLGGHPPKLPPVPAALGVHHNKLKQENPKLNSSCCGGDLAWMTGPWQGCHVHGRGARSMVGVPGPWQGCQVHGRGCWIWIWGDNPQQTCSNGQCRSHPLGSPHPTPLGGSEGNAFRGVSARPGLGPTSTFLCPDFIR